MQLNLIIRDLRMCAVQILNKVNWKEGREPDQDNQTIPTGDSLASKRKYGVTVQCSDLEHRSLTYFPTCLAILLEEIGGNLRQTNNNSIVSGSQIYYDKASLSFFNILLFNLFWDASLTWKRKQAGAELGQAQLQMELGFILIKVCCIILMITNYHCISWAQ